MLYELVLLDHLEIAKLVQNLDDSSIGIILRYLDG